VDASDWYLLFHLLGAFMLFAGAAAATGARLLATRPRTPGEAALLARAERGAVRWLIVPGAALAVVVGILLANHLDISLGEAWISVAFAMALALVLVAESVIARSAAELAREADVRGPDIDPDPMLARLAAGPVLTYGYAALNGLTLAQIVVMVWRPGS
jgi:hypothetical protein